MRKIKIIIGFTAAMAAAHVAQAGVRVLPPVNPHHPVVNINTATEAQLMLLPGVGPKLAAAITAARPFATVDALDAVKGIGAKKLTALRPHVVLDGATTAVAKIHTQRSMKAAPAVKPLTGGPGVRRGGAK